MQSNNIHAAPADVLDIVFSNRNKAYGAYFLRREYPMTMLKAFGAALLLLLLAMLAAWSRGDGQNNNKDPKMEVVSVITTATVEKPPVVEPPKPPKMEAPVERPQVRVVPPRIVDNSDPDVKPTDVNNLPPEAEVGKENKKGDPDAPPTIRQEDFDDGNDLVEPQAKPEDPAEPLTFVESMPTFPGGEAELLRYLASNIHYPSMAKENNIKGRVLLQFTVRKDGSLGDITILRDIGGGCGKEAARVLRAMPNWVPGVQNGDKVPVRIVLPVLFDLL